MRFAANLTVSVPAFAPGTTDPVTLEANVVNPSRGALLLLRAADEAGNQVYCKTYVYGSSSSSSSSTTRSHHIRF